MFCIFQLFLRIIGGLNMLRGLFIFLVFIFKRSVWEMIKKKHPRMAKWIGHLCGCSFRRIPPNFSRSNVDNDNGEVDGLGMEQTRQTCDFGTSSRQRLITQGSTEERIEVVATSV
jgi:hypothetical protein